MNGINIGPYIDNFIIHDDPEYCTNLEEETICPALQWQGDRCAVFVNADIDFDGDRHIKCNQCKEAYNKAVKQKSNDALFNGFDETTGE